MEGNFVRVFKLIFICEGFTMSLIRLTEPQFYGIIFRKIGKYFTRRKPEVSRLNDHSKILGTRGSEISRFISTVGSDESEEEPETGFDGKL